MWTGTLNVPSDQDPSIFINKQFQAVICLRKLFLLSAYIFFLPNSILLCLLRDAGNTSNNSSAIFHLQVFTVLLPVLSFAHQAYTYFLINQSFEISNNFSLYFLQFASFLWYWWAQNWTQYAFLEYHLSPIKKKGGIITSRSQLLMLLYVKPIITLVPFADMTLIGHSITSSFNWGWELHH